MTIPLFIVTLLIFCKAAYDRKIRSIDREILGLGLEDVVRRVSETRNNLADITALYNTSAIAKARSFAEIINRDPSILKDRERFENLAVTLDVDELHVSNSNGILVASLPATSIGYDMNSHNQSRPFMKAITDKKFEMVQSPMFKGIDNRLFQFAGVARRDEPGIVQVGFAPGRLVSARKMADIGSIVGNTRIGRGGTVSLIPLETAIRSSNFTHVSYRVTPRDKPGDRYQVLETEFIGYRIFVKAPLRGWVIADDDIYNIILFTMLGLLALILICVFIAIGKTDFKNFITVFAYPKELLTTKGNVRGKFDPILIICLKIMAIGLVSSYFISDYSARSYCNRLLQKGVVEIKEDFDNAINTMLYFVGDAICRIYDSPDAFVHADINEILHRYNIDELNVVNEEGIVVASSIGIVGKNEWLYEEPRMFNQYLIADGWRTYSQPFRESASEKGIFRKYVGVAFTKAKGYIQIGFNRSRVENGIDYRIEDIAEGWTVGENGYFICARESTGDILSCGYRNWHQVHSTRSGQTLLGVGFDLTAAPENEFEPFVQTLFGERCLCVTGRCGEFHRIVVAVPYSEIESSRNFVTTLVGAILFIVLLTAWKFSSRLSIIIRRLNRFIAEDRIRRDKDMLIARTVQMSSLPMKDPNYEGVSGEAIMHTAKEVGGDFYDYFHIDESRVLIVVADVSGKGISAAMFMMKAKATIKAFANNCKNLGEIVQKSNDRLAEQNDANMFVTAWFGMYNRKTGALVYVNCGHTPPILHRANGSIEWLRSRSGLVLGAMAGVSYRSFSLLLNVGDQLFLYTDGVTEAMNEKSEQFGEERLMNVVKQTNRTNVINRVLTSIHEFVGNAEQSDDITMMTWKRV